MWLSLQSSMYWLFYEAFNNNSSDYSQNEANKNIMHQKSNLLILLLMLMFILLLPGRRSRHFTWNLPDVALDWSGHDCCLHCLHPYQGPEGRCKVTLNFITPLKIKASAKLEIFCIKLDQG